MNPSTFLRTPINMPVFGLKLITAIALSGVVLAPQSADAQIIAEFSGGSSTSVVDAWTGKAGNGWSNAWTRSYTGQFPDSSVKIKGDPTWTSLNGDANYLRTAFKSAGASTGGNTIGRQYTSYGGVDINGPQEISFYYRIQQSSTASINDLYISDLSVISTGPYSAVTTWRIGVDPTDSTWRFGNGTNGVGNNWLDSNMAVSVGDIYYFRITILDPSTFTYNAYVENVTDNVSFASENLAFRTNKAVGGYLNFYTSVQSGDPNFIFDLTSVAVVPEPGSVLLLSAGLGLLVARRARRVRA